jgi:RNA polymerase sigma-70 factor (ECF subfamily)
VSDDPRRSWLTSIYQHYSDDVFNIIRWRLRSFGMAPAADDLLQDVFLTAYDKYEKLASHPDIRRWLFTTANFKCRNFIRRQTTERRRILWDADGEKVACIPDLSSENALAQVLEEDFDCSGIVGQIKADMTEVDKLLYVQAYEEKMPSAALSTVYGISETAMRMRISRLRKKVLSQVKNYLYTTLQCILAHII